MKLESIPQLAALCLLTLALLATALGQTQTASKDNQQSKMNKASAARPVSDDHVAGTTKDEEKQSKKAASLFKDIMRTPSRGIPQSVVDRAQCVAAFPDVRRSGSAVSGRGMVSCRTSSGWSAPVYLNIRSGGSGPQPGPAPEDVVIMFMTRDVLNSVISRAFVIGADTPAAAGPVGPDTPATTSAVTNVQVLCYSRGRGAVAGAMMDGATIEMDKYDMRDVYGDTFNSVEILEGVSVNTPSKVMAFSEALSRYTPRQARR
jgi:lipid-binding SYLF domain-containing protein